MFLSWMIANMHVCGQASYSDFVSLALRYQKSADSVQRLAEAKREELDKARAADKNAIRLKIREYETLSMKFQASANEHFEQALKLEVNFRDTSKASAHKAENEPTYEYGFDILPQSPYSKTNPIPIDEPLPSGVAYKIQMGAYSKPLPENTFKGVTPITGEKLENGVIKYYAGLFILHADADDALRKIRDYGFKDAYIVAFYNRITITPERAKQLEANAL